MAVRANPDERRTGANHYDGHGQLLSRREIAIRGSQLAAGNSRFAVHGSSAVALRDRARQAPPHDSAIRGFKDQRFKDEGFRISDWRLAIQRSNSPTTGA